MVFPNRIQKQLNAPRVPKRGMVESLISHMSAIPSPVTDVNQSPITNVQEVDSVEGDNEQDDVEMDTFDILSLAKIRLTNVPIETEQARRIREELEQDRFLDGEISDDDFEDVNNVGDIELMFASTAETSSIVEESTCEG